MTRDQGSISTTEEIQRFHQDGFLILDRPVLGRQAVADARARIDRIFAESQKPREAAASKGGEAQSGSSEVTEIVNTSALDPGLARSPIVNVCRTIAGELLGVRRLWFHFDHVISKESGGGTEVKWHQDLAYSATGIRKAVHFWIPLQDSTLDNGCMLYLPGSHRSGLRDHAERVREDGSVIYSTVVEGSGAVGVPIGMGGLACHDPATLHSSAPNTSGAVRRAWILHFGVGIWPSLRQVSRPLFSVVAGSSASPRSVI